MLLEREISSSGGVLLLAVEERLDDSLSRKEWMLTCERGLVRFCLLPWEWLDDRSNDSLDLLFRMIVDGIAMMI